MPFNISIFGSGALQIFPTSLRLPDSTEEAPEFAPNSTSPTFSPFSPHNFLISKRTGGAHHNHHNNNSLMSSALYLPQHVITVKEIDENQHFDSIETRQLLRSIFPGWSNLDSQDDLKITHLTGGITNMLLKCVYKPNTQQQMVVLVRAYGRGTDAIIDRDREFVSHLHLHSLKLAPPLYARFGNGIVYGFLEGRSITHYEMSDKNLMLNIAKRLGQWHSMLDSEKIETGILNLKGSNICQKILQNGENIINNNEDNDNDNHSPFSKNIWDCLEIWISNLPNNTPEYLELHDVLVNELDWLKLNISNLGGPTVVTHSDLLSGNIVIPSDYSFSSTNENHSSTNVSINSPASSSTNLKNKNSKNNLKNKSHKGGNPVSFIDYEYMLPAPRAFDLANHFMEWQGFDCETDLIPDPSISNPILRSWSQAYLSSVSKYEHLKVSYSSSTLQHHLNLKISETDIDQLIEEIQSFWGLPGFYWGIWALIQSTISVIDFDYETYSNKRLQEYWVWKKHFIEKINNKI